MSRETAARYRFSDPLSLDPIPPGSTVLVAGPALSPAGDLARALVADATGRGEGMLFVSTNMTVKKLLAACRRIRPSLATSNLGVIDCSGQSVDMVDGVDVKYISTQNDLTGIGMKFSVLYESMYADATDGRVRTYLSDLSSLLMYVDLRKLFKFLQTLSGRIDSADGLGVFTVDPTAHEEKTLSTLSHVVDGRIDVRETDGDADGELRIRGLHDQPDGWRSFSLTDP